MFRFRPLVAADLPTLVRWFSEPHARAWYGEDEAAIRAEYAPVLAREIPIQAFVVAHEGRDIGLVEWERTGDFPELQAAYGVEDPDMANCDVLVGEPDAAHRGLGPALIEAFLREIVFADPRITGCVIDPETDNAIAIRAYEKCGFRFARAAAEDTEGNAVYLLELRRDDLGKVPPPPFHLRPARAHELPLAQDIDHDACVAYAEVGLPIEYAADSPFALGEAARWQRAIDEGRLLFACTPEGVAVGFAAFGLVDGRPFLHQVSVRRAYAQRGIGTALVRRVQRWSIRPAELWLTTYDHVAWNRPFYERLGFVRQSAEQGPELRAIFAAECAAIPAPEQRVVMVHRHPHPMMTE